jgi:hypothetical protein
VPVRPPAARARAQGAAIANGAAIACLPLCSPTSQQHINICINAGKLFWIQIQYQYDFSTGSLRSSGSNSLLRHVFEVYYV